MPIFSFIGILFCPSEVLACAYLEKWCICHAISGFSESLSFSSVEVNMIGISVCTCLRKFIDLPFLLNYLLT